MSLRPTLRAAVAAWLPLLCGCYGIETVDLRDPEDIDPPDAGNDAAPPPPPTPDPGECPGMCAPLAPLGDDGWSTPLLLWFGPKEQAPACPARASDRRWEGYADLDAPLDCPACSCSAPTGSCVLPEKLTAADTATCPADGPGVTYTPFDPPPAWDGSCTTAGAISAGSGVRSLTFGPLQVVESGCTSSLEGKPPPKLPPPTWKTYAFACDAQQGTPPCKNGLFCMPAAPPSGFHACLFHKGELASCPKSYPEAHVFYPEEVTDTRACGACTCGAPWGSDCMALVSVYNDDACKDVQASIMVNSQPGACVSVMPAGVSLGSKSAAAPIYLPGTCAPRTSAPSGAAVPAEPSTFCCEGESGAEPRSRSGVELFDNSAQ